MFIIIKMFMYAISQRSALIIKKVLMFPRLCVSIINDRTAQKTRRH